MGKTAGSESPQRSVRIPFVAFSRVRRGTEATGKALAQVRAGECLAAAETVRGGYGFSCYISSLSYATPRTVMHGISSSCHLGAGGSPHDRRKDALRWRLCVLCTLLMLPLSVWVDELTFILRYRCNSTLMASTTIRVP